MINNSAAHSKLVNDILNTFSRGNCRLFKRHVGKFIPWSVILLVISGKINIRDLVRYILTIGIPGEPDIQGFLHVDLCPYAFAVAIEVKTGDGVRSKKQKNYAKMLESMHVIYILARSVQDVTDKFTDINRS